MNPDVVYLGVDVSRDSLDVCFLSESFTLPYSAAGLRKLLARIAKHPSSFCAPCWRCAPGERVRTSSRTMPGDQELL